MKTNQRKTILATAKSLPDPDLRPQIQQRACGIWKAGGNRHGEGIGDWPQAETDALERRRQDDLGRTPSERLKVAVLVRTCRQERE